MLDVNQVPSDTDIARRTRAAHNRWMVPFTVTILKEPGKITLKIAGSINETAQFPPFNCKSTDTIFIDLEGVIHINSVGIKSWIIFIKKIPFINQVFFQNIPKIIVDQMNMVHGFINSNSNIHSFYVPYYCEKCSLSSKKLFTAGIDFDLLTKEISAVPLGADHGCLKPDCAIAMDVVPGKYFRFIQKGS